MLALVPCITHWVHVTNADQFKENDRPSEGYHFRENAWSWYNKTGKIIVTARLAWPVGGLRSSPRS